MATCPSLVFGLSLGTTSLEIWSVPQTVPKTYVCPSTSLMIPLALSLGYVVSLNVPLDVSDVVPGEFIMSPLIYFEIPEVAFVNVLFLKYPLLFPSDVPELFCWLQIAPQNQLITTDYKYSCLPKFQCVIYGNEGCG